MGDFFPLGGPAETQSGNVGFGSLRHFFFSSNIHQGKYTEQNRSPPEAEVKFFADLCRLQNCHLLWVFILSSSFSRKQAGPAGFSLTGRS